VKGKDAVRSGGVVMRTLTDEALISAYVTAVSLQLEGEFIELLRKELIQRGLQDRDVEQWCKARA